MSVKALFLNGTLKKSPQESNTEALIKKSAEVFSKEGAETEVIRLVDYNIDYGIMEEDEGDDEWLGIHNKIMEADILVIATPIWLGEKSSIIKKALERLNGVSGKTNSKGQSIFYNKVGGVVVTGNEDGAQAVSRSVLYALTQLGFTIPPNVDTYWVGEAGPGASYIEGGEDNDFTKQQVSMMSYNLLHFARMLKEQPIPAEGNTME
ncbi:flavodoxin family protein [Evansella sp. LMS18]|uniref:flavodoxin family protein n=1 Tax=Evansella sp. LMS18 TaxID=2924033 RepID=UPI0020D1AE95|nr:flavodoxin family protein [Evansella sp. LMS18]UTR11167.1 flavodoxin family protein [Evansella sp. LMS18]